MLEFVKNNKYVLWFIGFPFLSAMYFILQLLITHHNPIWAPLDDVIPFVPVFIIPYIFWYIYIPLPMIVMCFKDKDVFMRQISGLYTGFALCLIFFTVYPTCITFRPSDGGEGIFGWICNTVFKNDNPWNVFPSLHCFEAWIIHLTTFRGTRYGKKKCLRILSAATAAVITASTVLVKQHSVLDMTAGCVLAVVIYIFVILIFRRKTYDNSTI